MLFRSLDLPVEHVITDGLLPTSLPVTLLLVAVGGRLNPVILIVLELSGDPVVLGDTLCGNEHLNDDRPLTDFQGEAWFISTPKGLNFFHELYQRGHDPKQQDWQSWHMPTTVNPHISEEEVARYRGELPELVFRQEYLAEFVTFGAGLVKSDMIFDGVPPVGLPVVLGVDLAISERQGADFTAIVAMSRDPQSGIVYIVEAERHRCAFNDVLARIKDAAARHSPAVIAIEKTQYQAAVIQELTRITRLPVRGVRPDKDKLTRFMPLLTRYEQRMVRHDPARVPVWFRDELLSFPEGAHDDGVDAASHAFSALDKTAAPPMTFKVSL